MTKTEEIYEILLRRVRTGTYTDKIPGERALAEEFDVNFKTANRAVSLLVEHEVLHRRRGEGTFVTPAIRQSNLSLCLAFHKFTDPGTDPVFARFFSGANKAAHSHGLRLHVTALLDVLGGQSCPPAEQRKRFREHLLATRPDAIVFLGNLDLPLIKDLRSERPTVVVGELPGRVACDHVRRDIRAGVRDAVQRFAEAGHERIALLTYQHGSQDYDLLAKEAAYADAVKSLGLSSVILRVPDFGAKHAAQRIVSLKSRPTAVIAAESALGVALVQHGPGHGLHIPDSLALVAFDDGDVGALTQPTMSGIHAFGKELAELAVRRVLERLNGSADGKIDDLLPCPWFERASTGLLVSRT